MEHGLGLHGIEERVIGGREPPGHAGERLGEPPGAQADPHEVVQDRAGFAHRQAKSFIEGRRQRQRARTEVGAGRAARRRDLERMRRGDPPAAAAAQVAVGDEADHVRADRRRLDERLLEDFVRLRRKRATAMRAARERSFDPAIDRLLRRPDAAGPHVSALPAGPLR